MGGDGHHLAQTKRNASFNPRPHMGGDTVDVLYSCHGLSFNPRPHMGGDTDVQVVFRGNTGFNPRPHMGGDLQDLAAKGASEVSIHAPTWGATNTILNIKLQYMFQSTPPHGGRPGNRRRKQ